MPITATERRVSPDDMNKARRGRELRDVRDVLCALPGGQRRSGVCRTGRNRVRLSLHRRRA